MKESPFYESYANFAKDEYSQSQDLCFCYTDDFIFKAPIHWDTKHLLLTIKESDANDWKCLHKTKYFDLVVEHKISKIGFEIKDATYVWEILKCSSKSYRQKNFLKNTLCI